VCQAHWDPSPTPDVSVASRKWAAFVVEQVVPAHAGKEQIIPPIVVVIANGAALSEGGDTQAGLGRHIAKGTIALIAEQAAGAGTRRSIWPAGAV